MIAEKSNKYPFISILLAIRNEEKYIARTLESLLSQDYPADRYEIIIADGESDDSTKEILQEFRRKNENIIILENRKRISAVGWNLGLQKARGKIVLILSGHAYINSNYLKKAVSRMNSEISGVGGLAVPVADTFFSKLVCIAYSSTLGSGKASYFTSQKEEFVETIAFGCYWKEELLKIGGFDEKIVRGQDWDLNFRIRKNGGRLLFDPDLKVFFYVKDSMLKLWKRHYYSGFWKIYIIRKNPDSILLRHIIPMIFSLLTMIALLLLILNPFYSQFYFILYFLTLYLTSLKIVKYNILKGLILFFIYFVIHFSYGLGMWIGLFYFKTRIKDDTESKC